MTYQVSARKWRPQTFEEVSGQSYVTQTLRNALLNNRIAHAYLFSGMHGVGKTTIARILAKALNCRKAPVADPCNECDMCKEISAGASPDVIEIDGASNTGVDDVRDLKESVRYSPSKGKYKVYIVDEVHMLSKSAFNAFLKTLEEPPSHTVFIFATTETQKIPETVQSRCQCYDFKRLSNDEMKSQLQKIAESEGLSFAGRGLEYIIRSAEGSMRDALVAFDQAVSYGGKKVLEHQVQEILGLVGTDQITLFMDAVVDGDISQLVRSVAELNQKGADLKIFCRELMGHVRNLTICNAVDKPAELLGLNEEETASAVAQAKKVDFHALQMMFQIILKTEYDMKFSPNPLQVLEMALIRMTTVRSMVGIDEILKKVSNISYQVPLAPQAAPMQVPQRSASDAVVEKRVSPAPIDEAPLPHEEPPVEEYIPDTEPGNRVGRDEEIWTVIKNKVSEKKPVLGGILEHTHVLKLGEKEIQLGFKPGEKIDYYMQEIDLSSDTLREVIKEVVGRELTIVYKESDKSAEKKKVVMVNEKWKKTIIQTVLDHFPGTVLEHTGAG